MSILADIGAKFQGSEGGARLYGLGLLASQMGAGQMPNAGPALQMLEDRKAQNALKSQMQGGDFMNQFTPQEQSFLATLPPAAAQQLIAQRIFAAPAAPVSGTEINGQLVNPQTGEVMGDYRTAEAAPEEHRILTPVEAEALGLNSRYRWQQAPDGKVSQLAGATDEYNYVATGEAAGRLGLDPSKTYNVSEGPEGVRASEIGSSGTTVNINESEVGSIPQGFEMVTDPETGARRMQPIPGGPEDKSQDVASSDATIRDSLRLIDSVINDPALPGITGMIQGRIAPMTQAGTDLNVKINQIKGQAFLNAFEQLKGGGTITEREGQAATEAVARLDRAQSTEAYIAALNDLKYILSRGLSRQENPDTELPAFALPSRADGLSDEDLLSKYGG